MRCDDPSRLLMAAGLGTAAVGVGIILVGTGRHAGYNVAAALLTLLAALFGYCAWNLDASPAGGDSTRSASRPTASGRRAQDRRGAIRRSCALRSRAARRVY